MKFIRDIISEKRQATIPGERRMSAPKSGSVGERHHDPVPATKPPVPVDSVPVDPVPMPSMRADSLSDDAALHEPLLLDDRHATPDDAASEPAITPTPRPVELPDTGGAATQETGVDPEAPMAPSTEAQIEESLFRDDMPDTWSRTAPEPAAAPVSKRASGLARKPAPQSGQGDAPVLESRPTPAAQPAPVEVPAPAAGRGSRRAARVKTRLLGFSPGQDGAADPFATRDSPARSSAMFPVGWLAVIDGPGRGHAFSLGAGVSQIGRGEDQSVPLDFGDTSISRANHAAIAYDPELKSFYLGHGGKANLVRLNDRPVLSTESLQSGDRIRIGETTLRFVALCGAEFDWADGHPGQQQERGNVAFG